MQIPISEFIAAYASSPLALLGDLEVWDLAGNAAPHVLKLLEMIDDDFFVNGDVAVHKTANIEQGVTIKGPAIIGPGVQVASGAYLRDGVWLDQSCRIGPGSEVKSAFIFRDSSLPHFNYVGNSVIGEDVNCEAGSIIANHYNEREDKIIKLNYNGQIIDTGVKKFGSLVGDFSRIGANAVLSPGTILNVRSIVPRLGLVDQISEIIHGQ